jgi:hypothetical protein
MISFTYTKDDGKTSDRVLAVMNEPTDKYFGIDISELSEAEQGEFSAKFSTIMDDKAEAIWQLMNEYDVRRKFRSFIPSRMANIVKE